MVTSSLAVACLAHGTDANQVSIRLAADRAFVVATPSSTALASFDDNQDGLLATQEVAHQRAALIWDFTNRFGVANESGVDGDRSFEDVSTPHAHDASGQNGAVHLRFTFRYTWAEPPTALRVSWRDAREYPLVVTARRVEPSPLMPEQTPLGGAERVELNGFRPAHAFFGPLAPSRPSTFPVATVVCSALALLIAGPVVYRIVRRRRFR